MTDTFPREEVEGAYRAILAAGDAGDWDRWADLHTEDCEWVEHHYGTIVGRDAIRSTITALQVAMYVTSRDRILIVSKYPKVPDKVKIQTTIVVRITATAGVRNWS